MKGQETVRKYKAPKTKLQITNKIQLQITKSEAINTEIRKPFKPASCNLIPHYELTLLRISSDTLVMDTLLERIQRCAVCKDHLPLGPRPVIQLSSRSKIIIIGQAPGKRVHETGIPWNDASGRKLREWMNVDEATFYDPKAFCIMPMGFCYPGKAASGDLPPRPECAPLWHPRILKSIKGNPLILLIGQYAQRYYLKKAGKINLTETVKHYKDYLPQYFPLPHPSPRNQNWVTINPWFMEEAVPELRNKIQLILNKPQTG